MYLPRGLVGHLYTNLKRTQHAQSPPVLLLVSLEPDALCACRILTALLKHDYIQHTIIPIAGYGDLEQAGKKHVQPMRTQNGGGGGTVVCLGVGGLVDLGMVLGLETTEVDQDATGGVEIWVIDARRPWNLGNVFGGAPQDPALTELNGNARAHNPEVSFGQIQQHYKPGRGGIIVFDDGDISEELETEREAYFKLEQLPEVEDDGRESDDSESDTESESGSSHESVGRQSKKRKSWSDAEEDSEDEDARPRQRRRSNSSGSISDSPARPARRGLLIESDKAVGSESTNSPPPSHQVKPVSTRRNRRRLLRLKRKHEATLQAYYSLGTSYSEPISSILYSLASELGREDNDALWYSIVGVSSLELYGRTMNGVGISGLSETGGIGGNRTEQIRQVLRDEVRRLNPPDPNDAREEAARAEASGVIPLTARSVNDNSIRLSPEPRFLLIRHWSLYESMLHSPYLAARLRVWNDAGRQRLNKLLAKMGMSLAQCKQSYTHMDRELKRGLRQGLLKYAPLYNLDGLVPPQPVNGRGRDGWGFVRTWGWTACLSAVDVGVIVGAILEVGKGSASTQTNGTTRLEGREVVDKEGYKESEEYVKRFWDAYDALGNVTSLTNSLPSTMHLHRAILRTGSALITKRAIRHLRSFRMAVVKEGPDVQLFTHPGALTKLALWLGEAIAEQDKDAGKGSKKGTPLVLAGLNEARGVYVIVGTGGGGGVLDLAARMERGERRKERAKKKEERTKEKEKAKAKKAAKRAARSEESEDEEEDDTEDEEDEDSEDEEEPEIKDRGYGRNRFGLAFQEVVEETNARIKIDSFEHCVVEVNNEDLAGFLEALSRKTVVG